MKLQGLPRTSNKPSLAAADVYKGQAHVTNPHAEGSSFQAFLLGSSAHRLIGSSAHYKGIQRNSKEFKGIQRNSKEFKGNWKEFKGIQRNGKSHRLIGSSAHRLIGSSEVPMWPIRTLWRVLLVPLRLSRRTARRLVRRAQVAKTHAVETLPYTHPTPPPQA